MSKKIFSLFGILMLAISYVQAYSTVTPVWHVNIFNNTDSPIMVGGIPGFPGPSMRAFCWWTGSTNRLVTPNQPLAAHLGNTWDTPEMSLDEYNCDGNPTTHYMEFMIGKETVSINSYYYNPGRGTNDYVWEVKYQGAVIATQKMPGDTVNPDVYVYFSYNGESQIAAKF